MAPAYGVWAMLMLLSAAWWGGGTESPSGYMAKTEGRDPPSEAPGPVQPGSALAEDSLRFITDGTALAAPSPRIGVDHRTVNGELPVPLVLGGQLFTRGLAMSGSAEVAYPVPAGHDRVAATIGPSGFAKEGTRLVFKISGDGREIFRSDVMTLGTPPRRVVVGLAGARSVTLSLEDLSPADSALGAPPSREGWGDWGDLILLRPGQGVPGPGSRPLRGWERTVAEMKASAYELGFSPTPSSRGYRILPWNYLDELDPSRQPAAWPDSVRLSTFVTPGEYEPLSFVVYADRALGGVVVETSDLRGPGGVIPSADIDLRWVMRAPFRRHPDSPPEDSDLVPRFLLRRPAVDLQAASFRQVHAILHVPDSIAPGAYEGVWTVRPRNAPPTQLRVHVEVLPFHLGGTGARQFGIYYRFRNFPREMARTELELSDIRSHGATMLIPDLSIRYVDGRSGIVPDYTLLERGLDVLAKHGFHGTIPVNTGLVELAEKLKVGPDRRSPPGAQQEFEEVGKEAMEGLVRLGARYPDLKLVATHMDEVFNRGRLPLYIFLTRVVRMVPGLPMYVTLYNRPGPRTARMMAEIDPWVDIRGYNGHSMDAWLKAGHTFGELSDELAKSGDEGWIYHNVRGSFFLPEWTWLVNSYYLWMSPLEAHTPWTYYNVHGDPLDDTDGPRARGHDRGYAVPSPEDHKTPIPTLQWEAYREGIDDLRYLTLLDSLLDVTRRRSPAAAVSAEQWMDDLKTKLPVLPGDLASIRGESPLLRWFSDRYRGADYEGWRRRTAEEIVKLLATH